MKPTTFHIDYRVDDFDHDDLNAYLSLSNNAVKQLLITAIKTIEANLTVKVTHTDVKITDRLLSFAIGLDQFLPETVIKETVSYFYKNGPREKLISISDDFGEFELLLILDIVHN